MPATEFVPFNILVEIELQSMQLQQVLSPLPTLVQTERTTLEYRITRTFVMGQNLESINSLLAGLMEDLEINETPLE